MDRFVEESALTLLNPRPGERVLDIGCGEGNHLLFFSKLGLDVNGIDPSPYIMSRARERLGNRCALKKGRAEDLPFDDNEFDLAVLINTLEFLDDPLPALREAGRVARRGVFIVVMNSLSWFYLCRRFQGLFRESLFRHLRFYNLWELKSCARLAFGDAPLTWNCSQTWPPYVGGVFKTLGESLDPVQSPFGSFIGLYVTIRYWVQTDQHPLKMRLKKTEQSIARGMTMKEESPLGGARKDERSLPI